MKTFGQKFVIKGGKVSNEKLNVHIRRGRGIEIKKVPDHTNSPRACVSN